MASNADWTASWWNSHSLPLNGTPHLKGQKHVQISDRHSPVSSVFSPTLTSSTTYGKGNTRRLKQSPLQRLFHHRQSGETRATSSYSNGSAFSTPRSTSFDQASNDNSPFTPAFRQGQKSPRTATTKTPPSTPYEQIPPVVASDTITYPELAHIWSHAAHLAHTNRNESARLLFTHLLGRSGIPPHLVALLPLNAGLIMLKEDALFPALHTFHVTARELCPSGALNVLATFLMAVAAWDLAAASATAATEQGSAGASDSAPVQLSSSSDVLGKSRLFFRLCLDEMGSVDDALDYTPLGLRWQLQRRIIVQNIDACDRAAAFAQVGRGSAWTFRRVAIERPPGGMLFLPAELAAEALRSCVRPLHFEFKGERGEVDGLEVGLRQQVVRGRSSWPNGGDFVRSRTVAQHPNRGDDLDDAEADDAIAAYNKRMASLDKHEMSSGLKARLMKELPPTPTIKH